ncbi:MAG: ABC transporter substrate-binding protein [Candidatus Pacebacteria bacterium]|nr:ABC transporter substrate-binding protein [Candidatus Paceibacterota bacterium]
MKEKIKQILNLKWKVIFFEKLSENISKFSLSEKVFFYIICSVLIVSGLTLLKKANESLMVDVPMNGGYLKEGIIGSPRFVNPILAVSDVDHDLTSLIYSGLMKVSSNNLLETDLADKYEISEDGLEYTFILKDDIYFHDGVDITTDDIDFTISKIQDTSIKSPKRPGFYDVKVEKIDNKTIKFILKKPYSPFLENLTIGILPKHLWNNLSSEQFFLSLYNVEPIGSGPYKISKMETLKKNMLLIPTYYELTPFSKNSSGKPFIDKLIINFYGDEKTLIEAYNKGDIESINSISIENISSVKKQKESEIKTSTLPRVFAIFFDENNSEILVNKEVRQALNIIVDRKKIVDDILGGYGETLYGPIPSGLLNNNFKEELTPDLEGAKNILTKAGWVKSTSTNTWSKKIDKNKKIELSVSISTLNSPDLVKIAEYVKTDWEKLGVKVDIKQFEFGDLQQNIIRPRKFEALLYGEAIGRDMDFFAFWHSSQRNDPGLNISMYTNSKVDKLLEDARKTQDIETRTEKYIAFEEELKKDVPAVFLYSPSFIYITPSKIKGQEINTITMPFERFNNISKWYIETNNLWKIFL